MFSHENAVEIYVVPPGIAATIPAGCRITKVAKNI
jgi:hypothetical protein